MIWEVLGRQRHIGLIGEFIQQPNNENTFYTSAGNIALERFCYKLSLVSQYCTWLRGFIAHKTKE